MFCAAGHADPDASADVLVYSGVRGVVCRWTCKPVARWVRGDNCDGFSTQLVARDEGCALPQVFAE
jgi:hypothetical protein